MANRVSPAAFHRADGVADWRVLADGAYVWFGTGSFADGIALVSRIGKLAAARLPDIDLRPDGVTVRLPTSVEHGLDDRDLELARAISVEAAGLGLAADPAKVQVVQATIDAHVHPDVMPFWRAVLGYGPVGEADLLDPRRRNLSLWFQEMDEPRRGRNRIHVDVFVPHDRARARVAAAVAAGGRVIRDSGAPTWWTLADAEGNEVDVATMLGRD